MGKQLSQNLNYRAVDEGVDPAVISKWITDAYLAKNRDRNITKGTFAPSSIGYGHGNCPRYWYLAFDGANFVDNNTAQGIANMENGSKAHDRLQALLKTTGQVVETEREFTMTDPPVRGFIDVIIKWGDEEAIGEIKTTKQEVFQIRKAQMKPPANNLLQLLIYMHAEGKRYGFFIYENKNTQEILVIPVVMNERRQAILDETLEWMRLVRKTWEEQTLPIRPYRKTSRVCKNCPLFEDCWSGPQGDIRIEEMPVPRV